MQIPLRAPPSGESPSGLERMKNSLDTHTKKKRETFLLQVIGRVESPLIAYLWALQNPNATLLNTHRAPKTTNIRVAQKTEGQQFRTSCKVTHTHVHYIRIHNHARAAHTNTLYTIHKHYKDMKYPKFI